LTSASLISQDTVTYRTDAESETGLELRSSLFSNVLKETARVEC